MLSHFGRRGCSRYQKFKNCKISWSYWHLEVLVQGVKEGYIPNDWRKSILVSVYKEKCDLPMCGSYRAISLLEQVMKVLEQPMKVLERG